MLWCNIEKIQFIHFLSTVLALGRSLIHFLDKFTWWHFQTTSKKLFGSKNFWAKLLLMKWFESAIKWLYPKTVSSSAQVLKQRIKVDKLDFFQKCIIAFEKFFLFWVPMNIQWDWKSKLESAYSFMLKYSKITVCI